MAVMKNKSLRAKKIERAKAIIGRCKDIKPPQWAVVWSARTS